MRSLLPRGRKQERSPALIPRKGWVASSCAVLTHLGNFPTKSLFAQRERITAATARLCAHMSEQAQAPFPNSRQLKTNSSELTSLNLAKSTGCCALHRRVLQHPKRTLFRPTHHQPGPGYPRALRLILEIIIKVFEEKG